MTDIRIIFRRCILVFATTVVLVTAETYDPSIEHHVQRCNNTKDSTLGRIQLGKNYVDVKECIVGPAFEKFTLTCNPNKELQPNHTVTWYFSPNFVDATEKIEPSAVIKIFDTKLELIRLNATSHKGIYECRIEPKNSPSPKPVYGSTAIKVFVTPYVSNIHREMTIVEGSEIKIQCSVKTSVYTTIVWKVNTTEGGNGTKEYRRSEGRIELENSGTNYTIINSILKIQNANVSSDRGKYSCFAESSYGVSVNRYDINIRIKGKYAAVWPFIGICAEVFLLCLIILIYEKKRDKTEMEESDTDQGPETKSSPDHGQDSIRFRK